MNFEIKLIPEAEETYEAIVIQLRSKWGQGFVIKFEDRVLKILKNNAVNPYLYHVIDERTEIRKCVIHQN